jgi:DNA-binding NarL/FixJ family response regulator
MTSPKKNLSRHSNPAGKSGLNPPTGDPVRRPAVRKRILIVDDHPMMRIGMTQLINAEPDLEVCGHAGDAVEALKQLPECRCDLVVCDVSLPGRSGLELIKDLTALHPGLPVLVISMFDETLHAERVLRAGARGYLMKEAGGEKMLTAIRQVLDGRIYVSERMADRILNLFSGQRTRSSRSPIEGLSDREFEVFQLIGEGRSTREIARQLNLSAKTVDVHRAHIKEKLGLKDATALVRHAVRWVEIQNAGGSKNPDAT